MEVALRLRQALGVDGGAELDDRAVLPRLHLGALDVDVSAQQADLLPGEAEELGSSTSRKSSRSM